MPGKYYRVDMSEAAAIVYCRTLTAAIRKRVKMSGDSNYKSIKNGSQISPFACQQIELKRLQT
jgi:hypothetical protein